METCNYCSEEAVVEEEGGIKVCQGCYDDGDCDICGKHFLKEDTHECGLGRACDSCMECPGCGGPLGDGSNEVDDGSIVCEDCWSLCDGCGQPHLGEDMIQLKNGDMYGPECRPKKRKRAPPEHAPEQERVYECVDCSTMVPADHQCRA